MARLRQAANQNMEALDVARVEGVTRFDQKILPHGYLSLFPRIAIPMISSRHVGAGKGKC
jgi:hypothetical protein